MTAATAQPISELKTQAEQALAAVASRAALEEWRVHYLGRKGVIPQWLRTLKNLSLEERKAQGEAGNAVRQELEAAYSVKLAELPAEEAVGSGKGFSDSVGHLHPLTLTTRRIQDIFSAMGFLLVEGPEVEEQSFNFDLLNISPRHPARSESDTFYIANAQGRDGLPLILRTHVSTLQTRGPREQGIQPPFKIVYGGRTFRAERTDATHESTFHQFEFMVVNERATLADLKGVIETFYSTFFQKKVTTRLRPSYFPFVEPGFEVDISCVFCNGDGCRICKHSGWIEIAGAGMVHPNVLKNIGVDPATHQGFALGGAVDRLAMLRYGITDIRLFWSGDIRFLKQFS
jgi:phenylalanyl-tRNA synthetase alpha chain